MLNPAKKISPAIFGIILICFFLPFVTVSCQNQKVMTLTGVQLATGTTIEQPSFLERQKKEVKIPADPLTSVVLVSTCVGLATSFLKSQQGVLIPGVTGAVSSVLLLMSKAKIDNEVLKEGRGLLQVEYGMGFWMSFLLFLSVTALNAYLFFQGKKPFYPSPQRQNNK